MTRILIADDHVLLAESLQFMLEQEHDFEVIGIVTDGGEAVEKCIDMKPDIVLMDIKMIEYDGIKATETIKGICPECKVVILTTFEDRMNILDAVIKGADGYILKDVRPHELTLALKCVYHGFCVIHETAQKVFQEEFSRLRKRTGSMEGSLKKEELDIIRLISDGKSNLEIAELLNYTEGTVKNKISRILETIGVKDRTQIVMYALKNDLI